MAVVSRQITGGALGVRAAQLICLAAVIRLLSELVRRRRSAYGSSSLRRLQRSEKAAEKSVEIDANFWRRLFALLRMAMPRLVSVEFAGVVFLTFLFYLRTRLTLLFARTVGRNGRYLVERDVKAFLFGVADVGLLAIPGSILHVGVQYVKMMVQQRLRDNLQAALHKEYLKGSNVYVIATQGSMIDNPDHRITVEAQQFCKGIATLFQSFFKPTLDVITLTMELSRQGGYAPPAFLISYYLFVATCMSALLPSFSTMIAASQEKEGNLRSKHHQLISHAEEIAFYGGEDIEREHTGRLLRSILRHEVRIKEAKWVSGLLDTLFIRYGSSLIGYLVCSLVTYEQRDLVSKPELTQLYLQSVQLYIPLSSAIGRMLLMHLRISALCGCVQRLGEMHEMFQRIGAMNDRCDSGNISYADDEIRFIDVDVVSPAGMELVRNFSLSTRSGVHTLILGCNGSGKTSLMRLIMGLWPLRSGKLVLPRNPHDLMCMSQRTYLPLGSLRTVLTYPSVMEQPDSANQNNRNSSINGFDDAAILSAASLVGLSAMLEREGGLDAIKTWEEVLSGGERQRVALTRVLLHRPKFVFLDESTSAVSQDDEPYLYAQLQKAGVTLITVSHRASLRSMHQVVVELDGEGGYRVSGSGVEEVVSS